MLLLIFHHQSLIWQKSGWTKMVSVNQIAWFFKMYISRKKWMINCIFGMPINIEIFYKLILSFWVCVSRHVKSIYPKWVCRSCRISRKACGWSSIPKVLKIASLQCFYNISKKKLEINLSFCMQTNIKVCYKLISALWLSKFPTRWH